MKKLIWCKSWFVLRLEITTLTPARVFVKTGKWDNYDLFLPQFGEVLSGAKREYEYTKILTKIERDQVKKENYALILKMAKESRLKPTAGAGIGMERLVGWIAGVKHIAECQPFPRVPGNVNEL